MKLEGEHLFAVARERLWEALLEPELLAGVLPGCEPLEPDGERRWKTAMAVAVGPVKGRYQGTLALSNLDPPNGYALKVDGSGPSGFLRGDGTIELIEAEAGTRLVYRIDAQVGGRIASVGQRLVESSARALAKQGLAGLERELAARAAAPAARPRRNRSQRGRGDRAARRAEAAAVGSGVRTRLRARALARAAGLLATRCHGARARSALGAGTPAQELLTDGAAGGTRSRSSTRAPRMAMP